MARNVNRVTMAQLLVLHEGKRKYPYEDTLGYLTIGVGRNLAMNGLSDDEIAYLLRNDMDEAERLVRTRFPWFQDLRAAQKMVLIDMAFNMGKKLFTFHRMIAALQEGDFDKAADEMLDSLWAEQVGSRATRLARMMRTARLPDDL